MQALSGGWPRVNQSQMGLNLHYIHIYTFSLPPMPAHSALSGHLHMNLPRVGNLHHQVGRHMYVGVGWVSQS